MIGKSIGALFLALISNASVAVAEVQFVCSEEGSKITRYDVNWEVAPDAIALCTLPRGQNLSLYTSPSAGKYQQVSAQVSEGNTSLFVHNIVSRNDSILLETWIGLSTDCDEKVLRYVPPEGMICIFRSRPPQ